jgi:hypothetical protein
MIQVLDENRKRTAGENFAQAFGGLVNQGSQFMQGRREKESLSKLLGEDLANVPIEFQKMGYQAKLNQQQQAQQLQGDEESYKALESEFGKQFADIWKSSPTGARTELLKKALDSRLRGQDVDQFLSKMPEPEPRISLEKESSSQGPQRPRGMTEAEWTKEKSKNLYDINQPVLKELSQMRKNIPIQEQAVEDIMNASPDVGWRDYLADRYNFEPLRTSEGVKLKTAIKDFFLSDLSRAGTRPNQWIEQQLAGALPSIGRSAEANQITAAGLQFKVDLAKRRQELIDELTDDYGYSQIDLDKTASKMMKSYVGERQKLLERQIRDIKNKKDSLSGRLIDVTGPDGQIYEVDESEVESLPEGFRIQ